MSQGNKWCDFCKIFLSNNPATIRNHELGQRHKENVAKRLTDMRKEKADKEKQEKDAAKALEKIEEKAIRSYQKDIATQSKKSSAPADFQGSDTAWEFDSSSGFYFDQHTGIHYDPKSGFYYSDVLGKWVTQEEAFAAAQNSSGSKQKEPLKKLASASSITGQATEKKDTDNMQSGPPPGRVISGSLNPKRSVKGAPSALAVGKRKRASEKPKAVSPEEEAALKAREAARKRVEEREKSLLGLYGN